MQKLYFTVILTMLFILPSNVLAEGLKAEAIVTKSWTLYRYISDEKELVSVVVEWKNGKREEKALLCLR